ncbi:MAG: hypothetical protein ACE37K_08585 [Planctomycetota bacterium]
MRGRLALASLIALPACAGGAPPIRMPDHDGPAVVARPLGGGDLRLEMTAPTAGYRLALDDVALRDGLAEVRLHYAPLPGDLFAQVLTELSVTVPAAALGDARAAAVLVRQGDGEPRLAVTIARPQR